MDPKVFGRYQIIRKLAGGGMGRVFLAYDPVLNRQVGLKLIDAGGDRDSNDVIAAERRGATLQDQLAKREASGCVAQMLIFGEAYLRRVLSSYAAYCNEVRTHLALSKGTSTGRTAQRSGKSSPSRSCAVCSTIMPG